ncbi:acyltransferase family protein [Acidovorax citrulli]|nr:acyltransferase family protein [Paracidovorax citrulli]
MLRHRVFKIDSSDNEQMNKDRIERAYDPKLDSIRIIACLAVVLLHVSARPIYMQKELSQWGWMLGNAVSSLTHWCVPVFVMLSGALVLGRQENHLSLHVGPQGAENAGRSRNIFHYLCPVDVFLPACF